MDKPGEVVSSLPLCVCARRARSSAVHGLILSAAAVQAVITTFNWLEYSLQPTSLFLLAAHLTTIRSRDSFVGAGTWRSRARTRGCWSSTRYAALAPYPDPLTPSEVFVAQPWCKHCQALEPVYKEAANNVRGLKFGKIDATEHTGIAKRWGVTGYPTIKWMRDGYVRPYNGMRNTEGFEQLERLLSSPPVGSIESQAELDMFR